MPSKNKSQKGQKVDLKALLTNSQPQQTQQRPNAWAQPLVATSSTRPAVPPVLTVSDTIGGAKSKDKMVGSTRGTVVQAVCPVKPHQIVSDTTPVQETPPTSSLKSSLVLESTVGSNSASPRGAPKVAPCNSGKGISTQTPKKPNQNKTKTKVVQSSEADSGEIVDERSWTEDDVKVVDKFDAKEKNLVQKQMDQCKTSQWWSVVDRYLQAGQENRAVQFLLLMAANAKHTSLDCPTAVLHYLYTAAGSVELQITLLRAIGILCPQLIQPHLHRLVQVGGGLGVRLEALSVLLRSTSVDREWLCKVVLGALTSSSELVIKSVCSALSKAFRCNAFTPTLQLFKQLEIYTLEKSDDVRVAAASALLGALTCMRDSIEHHDAIAQRISEEPEIHQVFCLAASSGKLDASSQLDEILAAWEGTVQKKARRVTGSRTATEAKVERKAWQCDNCDGSGRLECWGGCERGRKWIGECWECNGAESRRCKKCSGSGWHSEPCRRCEGSGSVKCRKCEGSGTMDFGAPLGSKPENGIRIETCDQAHMHMLEQLCEDREGSIRIVQAHSIENPRLHWLQARYYQTSTGRKGHMLLGFHGTSSENILAIANHGFDKQKRRRALHGKGDYFAKVPDIASDYAGSEGLVLVCQLCLGKEGTLDASNNIVGGDHAWVPEEGYYVMKSPEQVLPLYILRLGGKAAARDGELTRVLAESKWSNMVPKKKIADRVGPRKEECQMTHLQTDQLWLGYLEPDREDAQIKKDIEEFLKQVDIVAGAKISVVRGRFTQAMVKLDSPVSKEVVRAMNDLAFVENDIERLIRVDDAHGSPTQECKRIVSMYCRGQNLRFIEPCWCRHEASPTEGVKHSILKVPLHGAKGDEIISKFDTDFYGTVASGRPRVVEINEIINPRLQDLHEKYAAYLTKKNGTLPKKLELFHGTNNKILKELSNHGLKPPSDMKAADDCPISGGKGLCTSICDNSCTKCVEPHKWDRCHMFGLGSYLADLPQKSHRYVSQPQRLPNGQLRCRMLICSVVVGRVFELEGHLKGDGSCLHDTTQMRTLDDEDLEASVEFCQPCDSACSPAFQVGHHDMFFVKGLGSGRIEGRSVYNSEYVCFHPYQCLPRYEVVYDMD